MGLLALVAFLVTVILVLWRPGGMHEAIPALIGAFLLFLLGLVDRNDALQVLRIVGNSALTIISTFVMAAVLEGAGFFQWVGQRLIERAQGSGHRLFHLVLAFSTCLTLFLNNDGSIMLGTPIMLALVRQLNLRGSRAFPYLLGACLMASASSPPIGVSNMANLEAMQLVGISLTQHLRSVMVPALFGLAVCWVMLYAVFSRTLPERLSSSKALTPPSLPPEEPLPPPYGGPHRLNLSAPPPPPPPPGGLPVPPRHLAHPHAPPPPEPPPLYTPATSVHHFKPNPTFMWFAVSVVVLVRIAFFAASGVGIPTALVAAVGALILLLGNLHTQVVEARAAIFGAPWPILGFAFGMDLVVFGLQNAGVVGILARWIGPGVATNPLVTSFAPGLVTAAISSLLNNHPGLIIGSLTLKQIPALSVPTLHTAYSGVVLGSDLGALLLPVGTLAGLIWFHLVREKGYVYTWWEYVKVSLAVIPISFLASLAVLYGMALLMGQ